MGIERETLISLLKLTAEKPVSYKQLNKDANAPSTTIRKLLQRLQNQGLVYVRGPLVEVDSVQRVRLAVHALGLGADIERVSRFLKWKEFEDITAVAMEKNGYIVRRNLHFKYGQRRWEIDVIGSRKPMMICVDCKHWSRAPSGGALGRIVNEQVERTSALAKAMPIPADKLEGSSWSKAKLFPAVLTIGATSLRFHRNVPIVPVLQLQDFLDQMPAYADSLFSVQASINKLNTATQGLSGQPFSESRSH